MISSTEINSIEEEKRAEDDGEADQYCIIREAMPLVMQTS